MTKELRKTAIVTGGASGIGLAIARTFAQNDIFPVIIGRDDEKLRRAKSELKDNCAVISYDLSYLNGIPGLVKLIVSEHGNIDILINNAGVNLKKELVEVTDDEFNSVIQTNVSAVFALSREVIKNMLSVGSGSIINISSMAAQYGLPKVIAYTASKTAIEGMTRAMAVELAPKGIRVNCIAPGFIYSNMAAKALDSDPERKQRVIARTPMGRMGNPEDIGEAAYFLATAKAKFVTGVVLPVDGGNSIGF